MLRGCITVGVPLITPVPVLKINPVLNAGFTAYRNVPYPPLAVTGVLVCPVLFRTNVLVLTARLVTTAGGALTVNVNVLLAV